jgi:hypothetical protein
MAEMEPIQASDVTVATRIWWARSGTGRWGEEPGKEQMKTRGKNRRKPGATDQDKESLRKAHTKNKQHNNQQGRNGKGIGGKGEKDGEKAVQQGRVVVYHCPASTFGWT